MRASPLKRLWAIPLIWLPALTTLWIFVATRDWEHGWRQIQLGHHLTFPPRAKRGPKPEAIQTGEHVAAATLQLAELAAFAIGAVALVMLASRAHHRARRARAIERWELRLGRDDLANPYRVQEAFEGIAGAIGVRWYERVWRGPEHIALEVHRLDDAIRFVIAAPRTLRAAISGSLEDLYPDVALVEWERWPQASRCVVRLKKRASFVLSIQTTRNYEHAFSESLVALMDKGTGDVCVQLVLTPAGGYLHRRARRLLKRR